EVLRLAEEERLADRDRLAERVHDRVVAQHRLLDHFLRRAELRRRAPDRVGQDRVAREAGQLRGEGGQLLEDAIVEGGHGEVLSAEASWRSRSPERSARGSTIGSGPRCVFAIASSDSCSGPCCATASFSRGVISAAASSSGSRTSSTQSASSAPAQSTTTSFRSRI